MAAPTKLLQIVSYLSPDIRQHFEQDRLRAQGRSGHPISVSAYVETIIRRHLSKRLLRQEVGLEKRPTTRRPR